MSSPSVPCNLEDMWFDWKFEDTFVFYDDMFYVLERLKENYPDQVFDESEEEVDERDFVTATDDAISPLNYESTGFMETNFLEMKHGFSIPNLPRRLAKGRSGGDKDDGNLEKHVVDIRPESTNPPVKQATLSVRGELCAGQCHSRLNPIIDIYSEQNSFEYLLGTQKLQPKNINTSEARFMHAEIPLNPIEFMECTNCFLEQKVASEFFSDFFWTQNDENNDCSSQEKEELMKSRNDITGNVSNGCCDASSKAVNQPTGPRAGYTNPNSLMKRNEFLPQTIECLSNTTSLLKQASSTLTTRILEFCQSSLRLSTTHITPFQLGWKSCLPYAWLFFGIFPLLTSASTADTNVTVQHLTVMDGQSVILPCSVNHPKPVNWWHEHAGTEDPNPVYFDGFGILGLYRYIGRHSIEDGTNNLMIKNVTDSDAGKYSCEDTMLEERVDVYDIVILKSMPSCSSNIDLADVIGDNDCGIKPDLLHLHCTVVYSGNYVPRLHWQNSRGQPVVIHTNLSTPIRDETNYSTESTLTVTANIGLNDMYFTCQVADSQLDGTAPECRTQKLTVNSLYNSSVAPEIHLKSEKEISCTATSNQPCNYQWTYQTPKYTIAIHSSTLKFSDVSFGDGIYECQAECRLRGQICLTMPRRITVVDGGMTNCERTVGVHASQIELIVPLVVIIVAFVVAVACSLKYFLKFKRERRRYWQPTI